MWSRRRAMVFLSASCMVLLYVPSVSAQSYDPAQFGSWDPPQDMKVANPEPNEPAGRMVVVHAVLLRTGKVLCIDRHGTLSSSTPDVVLFDPQTGSVDLVYDGGSGPENQYLYCSGHVVLSDGRVLFAGGGYSQLCGTETTVVYDPAAGPVGDFVAGGSSPQGMPTNLSTRTYQIFKPPYFYNSAIPRPTINNAPAIVYYN